DLAGALAGEVGDLGVPANDHTEPPIGRVIRSVLDELVRLPALRRASENLTRREETEGRGDGKAMKRHRRNSTSAAPDDASGRCDNPGRLTRIDREQERVRVEGEHPADVLGQIRRGRAEAINLTVVDGFRELRLY